MSSSDESINENSCKDFYEGRKAHLNIYSSMTLDDLSEEELSLAYPIQSELIELDEHYRIDELIATGGMKEVYKVKELKSARYVAMAKLKKESDREPREAFLREARLTASLQHPNIVALYDMALDEDKSPFFTMELLEGDNLFEVIKKKDLSAPKRLDIFMKICDAVAYAHSLKIIHLDLKPDNIQLGKYGEVRVCDWGLAKILGDEDDGFVDEDFDPNILNHMTLNGMIKGSPSYMAPEQARGKSEKDFRTDIYSLGAILYTLFSAEAPIQGESTEDLIAKSSRAEVKALDSSLEVPASLEAIIFKALSLEPEDRYQSVKDLQDDLHKYIDGYATLAEDADFLKQLKLLIMRNKPLVTLSSIMLFIIAFVLLSTFTRVNEERKVAIEAKNKAVEQKKIAEDNFVLLQQEQALTSKLKRETDDLVGELSRSNDYSQVKQKIQLLTDALEREQSPKRRATLLVKKAFCQLVIQDFKGAVESFKESDSKSYRGIQNAAEWAMEEKGNKKRLSVLQLGQLLHKISNVNNFELVKAVYSKALPHFHKNTPNEDYLLMINVLLNANNNLWEKRENRALPKLRGNHLRLPSRPYHRFRLSPYGDNILAPLKIDELNVSGTTFFEFIQLYGLKLRKLNFAGCKVNYITSQRVRQLQSVGIKELVIDSSTLKPKELELLFANFEVKDLKKGN